MMKELKFKNPLFREGHNLTVRRGIRWGVEREAKIDMGIGLITFKITTVVMSFADLGNSDLADEHDEKCRNVDGLFEVMCQLYSNFDAREMVTLVSFEI